MTSLIQCPRGNYFSRSLLSPWDFPSIDWQRKSVSPRNASVLLCQVSGPLPRILICASAVFLGFQRGTGCEPRQHTTLKLPRKPWLIRFRPFVRGMFSRFSKISSDSKRLYSDQTVPVCHPRRLQASKTMPFLFRRRAPRARRGESSFLSLFIATGRGKGEGTNACLPCLRRGESSSLCLHFQS